MYEGWDAEKENQKRSTLVEKTMLAGMEDSTEFHAKREACIRKKYAADEIGQRILNGDGVVEYKWYKLKVDSSYL